MTTFLLFMPSADASIWPSDPKVMSKGSNDFPSTSSPPEQAEYQRMLTSRSSTLSHSLTAYPMSTQASNTENWGIQRPTVMQDNPSPPLWTYSPEQSPSSRRSARPNYGTSVSQASQTPVHYAALPQRRPSNRDEFDGPAQVLPRPADGDREPNEEDLPLLPTHLYPFEQDEILSRVNERLSQCAFDFVARYSFPIPIEPDKRPVSVASDREWSEWVYLLKRLATKRRIPARVLFNGQIRQFITVIENSLEMRHAAVHQSRPLKDDRNVLQLISSGIQVAKIVKDAEAMRFLDNLYVQAEQLIASRKI